MTHRCHIPTPGIFSELPDASFRSETLSIDPRTTKLVLLMTQNLANLQTLRIIHGHWNISIPLLEGILLRPRPNSAPLRRLWLENCTLEGFFRFTTDDIDASSLESIRFRRMPVHETGALLPPEYTLSRGDLERPVPNGRGGYDVTTVTQSFPSPQSLVRRAKIYDQLIYSNLPNAVALIGTEVRPSEEPPWTRVSTSPPKLVISQLLKSAADTLSSLNFDWILWRGRSSQSHGDMSSILKTLCSLRFPNLRAFQFRNAVTTFTKLPDDIFLLEPLDDSGPNLLHFMESHPNLTCLAWPMDKFFSHVSPAPSVRERVRSVIVNLGRTLVELRIDYEYSRQGEPLTDRSTTNFDIEERIRRRRFITEFARFMTKLNVLKMEGGIPRDEKREVVRALHACPLQKLILIGLSFPIGNSWGREGHLLREIDENVTRSDFTMLEDEQDIVFKSAAVLSPQDLPTSRTFEANFGENPRLPLVSVIASSFSSSITELKFCGFNGSIILRQPTEISDYLLYPLRHFHNLRNLVLSMWLLTFLDNAPRDSEIIKCWIDAREPLKMALVAADLELNTQSVGQTPNDASATNPIGKFYSPQAMAEQVNAQVSVHLSALALAKPSPFCVRASFCLGENTGDIFDLELYLKGGGVNEKAPKLRGTLAEVIKVYGPREESEQIRQREKLVSRKWF